jgi:hypothetical protein
MAALTTCIEIKMECRPCFVNGKKAMFHKWVESSQQLGNYSFRETFALVEYEDGTVKKEPLDNIKFADGGNFEKTAWREKENDN